MFARVTNAFKGVTVSRGTHAISNEITMNGIDSSIGLVLVMKQILTISVK